MQCFDMIARFQLQFDADLMYRKDRDFWESARVWRLTGPCQPWREALTSEIAEHLAFGLFSTTGLKLYQPQWDVFSNVAI